MNLKHFTSYNMFINFVTKSINDCLKNIDNKNNEPSKEPRSSRARDAPIDTNKNNITSEILIENN